MIKQIYSSLWFDSKAKDAAEFYCSIFKDGKILEENSFVVAFEINGTKFIGINGGPMYHPTPGVSFVVECADQKEIDHYWDSLTSNGGEESRCGWLVDKFGFSWQIIPENMGALISNPKAMQAMMQMKKIDIEVLKNA